MQKLVVQSWCLVFGVLFTDAQKTHKKEERRAKNRPVFGRKSARNLMKHRLIEVVMGQYEDEMADRAAAAQTVKKSDVCDHDDANVSGLIQMEELAVLKRPGGPNWNGGTNSKRQRRAILNGLRQDPGREAFSTPPVTSVTGSPPPLPDRKTTATASSFPGPKFGARTRSLNMLRRAQDLCRGTGTFHFL
jgi:hypothetical protein